MGTKYDNGFTLLELLIVLCFSAVVGVYSAASLNQMRESFRISAFQSAVLRTLKQMLLRARIGEEKIDLLIRSDEIRIVPPKGAATSIKAPPQVQVSLLGQMRPLTFYPSGVTTPFTLKLTTPLKACVFAVSLRGRITQRCVQS